MAAIRAEYGQNARGLKWTDSKSVTNNTRAAGKH